ncbi:hypothetical protein PISMIDRAFT_689149 [Pisolithus microcarpus 441]|uniref:Uncharacterized protein n=1 Tax=Pisolithus microcarpus 441 TaxID=765257 RepID=A0A0C9YFW5_9AGAM|nr:hypothetical protein PISMIDRAFT_689149 [Pisolithus microcarpus 441]
MGTRRPTYHMGEFGGAPVENTVADGLWSFTLNPEITRRYMAFVETGEVTWGLTVIVRHLWLVYVYVCLDPTLPKI